MKCKRFLSALLALTLVFSLCTIGFGEPGEPDATLQKLQTNNSDTPYLAANTVPQFSWQMRSDTVGQKQTAYRVLVSTKADAAAGELWDSGKTKSDASLNIAYAGAALAPRTRYYWRVTVWDKDGKAVESEVTWFETALRQEDFEARLIAAPSADAANGGSLPMFRKSFETLPGKKIESARLYATALGLYDAFLNGEQVAPGEMMNPGWTDYTQTLMYQTYDITGLLNEGANALGAATGSGWYAGHISGNVNRYGKHPAFLAQLEIAYTDGSLQKVCTDGSWQVSCKGPYELADNEHGETYNAGKEMLGWVTAQYDGADWSAAQVVTGDTAAALLHGSDFTPPHPVNPDAVKLTAHVGSRVKLGTEQGYDVRKTKLVYTLDDPDNPGGKRYILDCGQNIAGIAKITVRGGQAGTKIRLRFAEMLHDGKEQPEGEPYLAALRSAKATDYYTKRGSDAETYQPRFTFHGFRYIEVSGYPGELNPADVTAIFLGSELTQTGKIESSDADLNQLFQNVMWGQRDNFLSIPTDCPQRDERLGWTGDIAAFCDTAVYNRDVREFLRKYLTDLVQSQRADGAISDVAPNGANTLGYGAAAWADAAVIVPWSLYQAYGDESFLRDYYTLMQGHVFFYTNFAASGIKNDADGHSDNLPAFDKNAPLQPEITDLGTDADNFKYIAPGCAYGDWLAPQNTPNNVVATAYFAHAASLLSESARVLGKTQDATYYKALSDRVKKSFQRVFWDAETGRIAGNSQTAYLLAIEYDLLPDTAARVKAGENLALQIANADYHLTTGFVGAGFLLPSLSDLGYDDLAYRLLLTDTYPSWIYSIRNGATTTWERWNSYTKDAGFGDAGMNSFNHFAFGSVMEWVYRYAAGIQWDAEAPGGKHSILRPTPGGGVKKMNTSLDSVYGNLQSNWTVESDRFRYEITVPANTAATVLLPAKTEDGILANGKAAADYATQKDGIRYVGWHADTQRAEFAVVSGSFSFECNTDMTYRVRIGNESKNVIGLAEVSVDGEKQTLRLPADIPVKSGQDVTFTIQAANTVDFSFDGLRENNEPLPGAQGRVKDIRENHSFLAAFRQDSPENLLQKIKEPVIASRDVYGESSYWNTAYLTDGILVGQDGKNGFTSEQHRGETPFIFKRPKLVFDLGGKTAFNQIRLYPRTDTLTEDGKTANFPTRFIIEGSNNRILWKNLVSEKGYEAPCLAPAVFDFDAQSCRYVRIRVLKLGTPVRDEAEAGAYRFQLTEFAVVNTESSPAQSA